MYKKKVLILGRSAVYQKSVSLSRSIEIRFINPLSHLAIRGEVELTLIDELHCDLIDVTEFDVIIFCRHSSAESLRLHIECRKKGIRTIYDLDDLVLKEIPKFFDGKGGKTSDNIIQHLRAASVVTVENESLASFIGDNTKVKVIPNVVDFERFYLPFQKVNGKIRIIFVNAALLKFSKFKNEWIDVLRQISEDHRFELHLLIDSNRELEDLPNAIYHNSCGWHEHMFKLNLIKPHIGLVPLTGEDEIEFADFNKCKSVIKYINFTVCGTVGIYSNVPPYLNAVKNMETGLLVNNSKEEWWRAIDDLASNNEMRLRLLENAIEDIKSNLSLNNVLVKIREVLGC